MHTFFAAISDFEVLFFSLLGGLEPPTFRLTAERASRLRHKSSITCVGWFFMNHSGLVLWEKFIFESLKLSKHWNFMHHSSFVLWEKFIFESLKLSKHSQKLWNYLAFSKKFECFKKNHRRNDTSPHKGLETLTVGLTVQRSIDWASLTNLIFQIQEFEALDLKLIT